jgi:hypothetical protein
MFLVTVLIMSSASGDKRFCKTCNIWISGHPGNVLKHESSGLHKANVQKRIREASELATKSRLESDAVARELNRASLVAEASMLGRLSSHPLQSGFELEISRSQPESVWITCRTTEGRIYYANSLTGLSQWSKPVELGGIAETLKPQGSTETQQDAGPPKPRTVAAAPPRPKTGGLKPPPKPLPKTGDQTEANKILESLIVPGEEKPDEELRQGADPTTGFGEWETVTNGGNAALPHREAKRLSPDGNLEFARTVTKKNRRVTREEDG